MNKFILGGIAAAAVVAIALVWVGGDSTTDEDQTRFPSGIDAGALVGTTASFTGLASLTGGAVVGTVSVTDSTTLTTASCGELVTLDDSNGGAVVTLPAATGGCVVRVVVGTAFDTANIVIDSAEGDNIEGSLIVNAANVACSGEDQINVVQTAEAVGDRVTLISDGTSWYIDDSNGVAAGSLTCTDPS